MLLAGAVMLVRRGGRREGVVGGEVLVDEDNVDVVIMSDLLKEITEKLQLNYRDVTKLSAFYPGDFRSKMQVLRNWQFWIL